MDATGATSAKAWIDHQLQPTTIPEERTSLTSALRLLLRFHKAFMREADASDFIVLLVNPLILLAWLGCMALPFSSAATFFLLRHCMNRITPFEETYRNLAPGF